MLGYMKALIFSGYRGDWLKGYEMTECLMFVETGLGSQQRSQSDDF